MKGYWPYLLVAVLALGAVVASLISIAPPHIFERPKFYLLVAGELVLVYGFAWLTTRNRHSSR